MVAIIKKILKSTIRSIAGHIPERVVKVLKRNPKFMFRLHPEKFFFEQEGFCPCCDQNVTFRASNHWLRDNFLCSNCNSIPRERALMVVIEKFNPNWRHLVIHESSPVYIRGTSPKLRRECNNYIPTEFVPNEPLGREVEGFRNENLEKQTFSDESIDLVVTQDVMEHVNKPDLAFKEIARTLKPGGMHIFTVPLINKFNKSERWANFDDKGEPQFLNSPDYHGPWPVTMHWGYDILDFIESSSGLKSNIEYIDDLSMGIRAEYIEVIVSKKK